MADGDGSLTVLGFALTPSTGQLCLVKSKIMSGFFSSSALSFFDEGMVDLLEEGVEGAAWKRERATGASLALFSDFIPTGFCSESGAKRK